MKNVKIWKCGNAEIKHHAAISAVINMKAKKRRLHSGGLQTNEYPGSAFTTFPHA